MRMKAPTGVCKSASTDRTTGTTLPCRASRSNASNVAGCRSSILVCASARKPIRGEPLATVDNQHHAVDKTRRVGTDKNCCLLDVGNSSKASERNALQQSLLDRLGNETFHSLGILD